MPETIKDESNQPLNTPDNQEKPEEDIEVPIVSAPLIDNESKPAGEKSQFEQERIKSSSIPDQ